MVKSELKLVLAWTHAQALHFAKSMEWQRSEWRLVRDSRDLKGMYGIVLYDLRAPRYTPSIPERHRMEPLRAEIEIMQNSGRIVRTNVVNLS